jgi:hypothetical protein
VVLDKYQGGEQETAQNKEDVDSEESSRKYVGGEVEENNGCDC